MVFLICMMAVLALCSCNILVTRIGSHDNEYSWSRVMVKIAYCCGVFIFLVRSFFSWHFGKVGWARGVGVLGPSPAAAAGVEPPHTPPTRVAARAPPCNKL
jgi:hypothetical protein